MFLIKNYDPEKYNFCKEVERFFGAEKNELDQLHIKRGDLLPPEELNFGNETRTKFHKLFYENLNSDEGDQIREIYNNFISNVISPIFEGSFLYQKFPSFRVHLPNDRAIHKWHYDSDAEHKHPDWEINFQLALTKMFDSNATWIESIPGIKDYKPMELEVGQFSIFDGNKLTHGNKPNVTNKTRVSMDFRVIPYDKYEQFKCKNFCWGESLESVTTSRKFDIGGYYNLYEI